jgi:uncharacterized membrane protein
MAFSLRAFLYMGSHFSSGDGSDGDITLEESSGSRVIDRNIKALLDQKRREESGKSFQGRAADAITAFTGSMVFVYVHLVIFGAWIGINIGWIPFHRFDPSLVILAMAASVEAIFLSTFVLISQNRMAALADKRANLDLQISLLAEHEISRLISLTTAIAAKLQMQEASDPELHDLSRDVEPKKVLQSLEQLSRNPEE